MSEVPSYVSSGQPYIQSRLSGKALTSLILGILFCIPVLPSILAIFFAIGGFRATRIPGVKGRGFAIAGLVMGICGTIFWVGIACFVTFLIIGSRAPRATLHDFQTQLAAKNISAASSMCESTISSKDIESMIAYMDPFGSFIDLRCTGVNLQPGTCVLSGYMQFSKGPHTFTVTLTNTSGTWKIYGYHISTVRLKLQ